MSPSTSRTRACVSADSWTRLLRQTANMDGERSSPTISTAGAGGGDQHAAGAAADLQHRAAGSLGHFDEERHVAALRVRRHVVIELGREAVLGVATRTI